MPSPGPLLNNEDIILAYSNQPLAINENASHIGSDKKSHQFDNNRPKQPENRHLSISEKASQQLENDRHSNFEKSSIRNPKRTFQPDVSTVTAREQSSSNSKRTLQPNVPTVRFAGKYGLSFPRVGH